jgi:hypothetical protein
LDETIWSLTSPRVKRISGSKNFRSPSQKDFCNNIDPTRTWDHPAKRLTRIAGYRIGGDQSGGTGTILQTFHELASFQLVELHLIPASQGYSAAWPHAAVRHHQAQSPQYLSKQTSGGTIDEALACQGAEVLRQQRRRCFLSLHFLFKDLTHYQE